MPKFTVSFDQNDAAFFGGLGAAVVGVLLLVGWPSLLVAGGAGVSYLGWRGAVRGSAGQSDPPARD